MGKITNVISYNGMNGDMITGWDRKKQTLNGLRSFKDGAFNNYAKRFKELWDKTGCAPHMHGEGGDYNWNINTKIDNMSYLERMKDGQKRVIEHAQSQIDRATETLEKLEHIGHPTNKELYKSMASWEIVNIGNCFKITVPQNVLISPEQEEVVKNYVRLINNDRRDDYGGASKLTVEVDRVKII